MTYSYDGDGRRAAKVGSKFYWYGSGGEILAESDAAGNALNEYVYFGGRRLVVLPASGTPLYYGQDMLGSSRVMVQADGTLCYDADFTPFGAERPYTSTCAQNYKFEGKERDTETQNDDFGARNYSWRFGRWLSADWSSVPVPVPYANLTNPQTLNLYLMVADDPESFADLDGHFFANLSNSSSSGVTEDQCNGYQSIDGCPDGHSPGPASGETDLAKWQAERGVQSKIVSAIGSLDETVAKATRADIRRGSSSDPAIDNILKNSAIPDLQKWALVLGLEDKAHCR